MKIKKLISVFMLVATLLFNSSCTKFCADALADLIVTVVSIISPTGVFSTGTTYPITATISNVIQCIAAGDSQTNLSVGYSSSYSPYASAYSPSASFNTPTGQIAANGTAQMNRQVSFNRAGYYLFQVAADKNNSVTETIETNNDYNNNPAVTIRSVGVEQPFKGFVIEVKQGCHVWKEGEPMVEIK